MDLHPVLLAMALSLGLAMSAAGTAPARADGLADLLGKHGIQPLVPSVPATDFTLPDLDGQPVALSDLQGRWVLLTFWATWCGPCRTEMPGLDELHRQRSDAGLTVLGVSIDSDRSPIRPFVESLGLTFPNLWDERGEAARAYRAASIPLSYLIDPAGRVTGVARGARDWTALVPVLDAALDALPPGEMAGVEYAAAGSAVPTPSVSDPPSAEVSASTLQPLAGEPFYLDIRLRWSGDFSEYVPHRPRVELPAGVERLGVVAESSSRDGSHVVTYRVSLVAEEPGSYSLDPVELSYTSRFDGEPVASRVAGPTVEALPRPALSGAALAVLLGGGGLLTAAAAATAITRRRAKGAATEDGVTAVASLRRAYDAAIARRLEGDAAGCALGLAEIERRLGPPSEAAERELAERIERARYGGEAPAPEELERLARRIEKRLDALRSDPREAARAALKLRHNQNHDPALAPAENRGEIA